MHDSKENVSASGDLKGLTGETVFAKRFWSLCCAQKKKEILRKSLQITYFSIVHYDLSDNILVEKMCLNSTCFWSDIGHLNFL